MKKISLMIVCLLAMMAASTGLKAQEVTILLRPGWNWIGYPYPETVDLETAFGDFEPLPGDVIESNYEYSEYLSVYGWFGGVNELHPGWGYMYFSNRTEVVSVVLSAPASQSIVTTGDPTDITTNSATSGGSITTDAYVFAKGICWAAHSDPTPMDDNHSENGGGDESFTAEMTELNQNTTYYVRAYVVTQDGITYGNELSFTTIPIWTIAATPNPTEGGTITGAGDYEQNAICNLTAIANEGYIFANWTENGEVVSTDATYTFTVDAARTLVANFDLDHTYVDLGLPSGTLWATCNLGANLPEEYGDYFAWGETQPKDNFSWTNYQYCMGSFNTLTKYCNNPDIGYNGFTDDLTTLEPSDDAATANWGDDWRMPTDEEWQELYQNTTVTWTTRNGVNGRLFTASNGNSLFLPAAGYRNESTPEATGIIGDYWTSSLDTDYPSGALSFFFNSSNYYISFCNRLYGRNVRAVRSGSQNTAPTGAIDGKFTINSNGDQVYFSQGNLQYIGSAATPYWKFADNQWDVLGTTGQNSSDQNVDRDLFGWGTSGWNNGNVYYQPYDTQNNGSGSQGYGYGPTDGTSYTYNLTGTYANADWGVYNPISNGGNQANQWRTLTQPEWAYVFDTRTTNSGIRYAKAKVNNMNGVILLPDNWSSDTYSLSNTNSSGASFSSNTISASQWNTLEQAGAVFLPAAGYRYGTSVYNVGSYGLYWSASYYDSGGAYYVYFGDSYLYTGNYGTYRYYGFSVRLARVAE